MKQTLSGRNSIVLWLALVITLVLFVAVGYYFVIWQPGSITRQNAERALAECRTQVATQRWDDAERACNQAVILAPGDLAAEARDLLQRALSGWLDYHFLRGKHLLEAGEPALALVELEKVFVKDPTYPGVVEQRRRAQAALPAPAEETPLATALDPEPVLPTETPDAEATATAWAITVEAAVQATFEAQAAQTREAQAEETRQAEKIAATLTALAPTFTPTPTRTPTRRPAATFTPTATRTPTATPNRTATARVHATLTAEAQNVLPFEVEVLLSEWDRIHHESDYTLDPSELSSVLGGEALQQQIRTLDRLRSSNCYWIFTDLAPAVTLGWRRISSTELLVDVRKHWDGRLYCNGRLSTTGSFNEPFNARYVIKKTGRWLIMVKTEIRDDEVMWGQQR